MYTIKEPYATFAVKISDKEKVVGLAIRHKIKISIILKKLLELYERSPNQLVKEIFNDN